MRFWVVNLLSYCAFLYFVFYAFNSTAITCSNPNISNISRSLLYFVLLYVQRWFNLCYYVSKCGTCWIHWLILNNFLTNNTYTNTQHSTQSHIKFITWQLYKCLHFHLNYLQSVLRLSISLGLCYFFKSERKKLQFHLKFKTNDKNENKFFLCLLTLNDEFTGRN